MSFRMRISITTQCHNPKLGSLFRHGDNQIMNRNALWLLMLVALLIGMLSMYMPGRAVAAGPHRAVRSWKDTPVPAGAGEPVESGWRSRTVWR